LREELSEQAERIVPPLEAWQSRTREHEHLDLQGLVAALEAKDYVYRRCSGLCKAARTAQGCLHHQFYEKQSDHHLPRVDWFRQDRHLEIGVAQYTDGRYYWTLNGECIIDARRAP
jgi:hypothetical protein